MTKAFKANPDVEFGDVNLSKDKVRTSHGEAQNPGAGGWPTIRYFNKDTGYGGKVYPKKTSKAMCDELGDLENMQAYIEEMGNTVLCSLETGAGCSDDEKDFLFTWKDKTNEEREGEVNRLKAVQAELEKAMSLSKRMGVLGKLSEKSKAEL